MPKRRSRRRSRPAECKATLAYRLARRLLSPGADPNDPANPVFRRIAAGSHADLLTVERAFDEKRKRTRTMIAVEQTRAIGGFMHLTAAEGGWRVVVVDGADDMNPNAANALLKILEEPSRRGLLFLTADAPGRLLPTIRSRCRRLQLGPLPTPEMEQALRHLLPELEAAERSRLAAIAEGAPGQAAVLAGEGALAVSALVDQVLAEVPGIGVVRMHEVADRATRTETGFALFMTLLQSGLGKAIRAAAMQGATVWTGSQPGAQASAGHAAGGGQAVSGRALAEWGEVWHALGRLQDETERFNGDKRSAIVAGLELLTDP
jgi:DNA polymerase-3 subunit delta'